ncbi:MAG: hypothetical protein M1827_001101 [Pycnora praestabilis]|nr:MAG: hypothetical protein M1827_001101 [Pycnora praestabilis]
MRASERAQQVTASQPISNISPYEISVTHDISVGSGLSRSARKNMVYAGELPSDTSTKPHVRIDDRCDVKPAVASRRASGFSFSDEENFLAQPLFPSPQLPQVPGSGTFDLAFFLKNTGPPPRRARSAKVPTRVDSTKSNKKSAFSFLKPSNLSNNLMPTKLRKTSAPNLLRLPETVVARTSTNGKRYFQIALSGVEGYNHASEEHNRYRAAEFARAMKRTGNTMSSLASSGKGTKAIGSARGTTVIPASWGSPPESLGDDALSIYDAYTKGGKLGMKALPESKTVGPNYPDLRAPNTDRKDVASQPLRGNPTTDVAHHVAEIHKTDGLSKDVDAAGSISSTTSNHGLVPPRTSSIRRPNPATMGLQKQTIQPEVSSQFQDAVESECPIRTLQADNQGPQPSASSTHEPAAGIIRADNTSGIVINTQKGHAHRPSSSIESLSAVLRNQPRPGPAPTRALPSLPEVRNESGERSDALEMATKDPLPVKSMLKDKFSHSRSQSEPSPKPSGSTRTVENPLITQEVRIRTNDYPITQPTTSECKVDPLTKRIVSNTPTVTDCAFPIDSASDTLRSTRKSREERVHARKMRDLQALRDQQEEKKATEVAEKPALDTDTADDQPLARQLSNFMAYSPATTFPQPPQRSQSKLSPTKTKTKLRPSMASRKRSNGISPIMLVVDNEPVASASSLANQMAHTPNLSSQDYITSKAPITWRPTTPIHSSEDESLNRRLSNLSKRTSASTSEKPASASSVCSSTGQAELEAKIEARMNVMERKNALLEAALLAVIHTSANMAALPAAGGSRISGLTSGITSPSVLPFEVRLKSRHSHSRQSSAAT